MSTQFFNTFRTSKNLQSGGASTMFTKTYNNMNTSKRDKLKNLIVEKMTKKYKLTGCHPFIYDEVDAFVHCNNLCEKDLKNLDKRINHLLKEKGLVNERLSKSVETRTNYAASQTENNKEISNKLEETNNPVSYQTIKTEDNAKEMTQTKMSGASQLSNLFNPNANALKNRNDPEVPEEELIKPKKKPHRFEFEHEDDMWNAFNNVNRRIFEQEKIEERMKDKEIKRRTKEDLDNQIKHKLLRLEEERNKSNEYHSTLINHIDYLNRLEEEKQAKIKSKILKEKENRDKQMWDMNYRKKLDKIKNRKYENHLLEYIDSEIKREKEATIKKKIEAKENLQKTLEENQYNKILKDQQLAKEREDDMKSMEEYNRILEKQENDRIQYFKNIELKSTDFMAKMTDTVLKDLKEKNRLAEERMNDFLKKKEERAVEDDKDKLLKAKEGKKQMKKFLDMQVEEKKKLNQFEKDLDEEQAFIIKKDYELYEEYKKDAAEKVRYLYI